MAKRVTLYIQDDEVVRSLELIQNKSGLVTELLRAYFEEAVRLKEEQDAKKAETTVPRWG